jgi:hypothetical protein
MAPFRPAGYLDVCFAFGRVKGDWLEITPEDYGALRKIYKTPAHALARAGGCNCHKG